MTDISGYEGVFDEIFQGKKYVLSDIPGGISFDIKVKATCEGKDYIIKIIEGNSPNPNNPEKRLMRYPALAKIREENNSILCPFWFNVRNGHVVTATEWIHGKQLNEVFMTTPELMVSSGKKVGKVLRAIHQQEFVRELLKSQGVTITQPSKDMAERLVNEIRAKGISFAGIDKALNYLNCNIDLVSDERAGIIHNDVRPENFILKDDDIYIFDFDSGYVTDYYADFTYLSVMSEKEFRPFSYGLIMSYFDTKIPDDFWKVNLVFSIMKLLDYSIYKFNKKGTMVVHQAASFIETFEDYTTVVPTWWNEYDEKYRTEYIGLGE